ncbi:hypothetical protein QVD17_27276 [Tagetes erecta]|uniref:Uncharacterized protein n=1 Tax=Tagetes erecta TaxID=13708 RepID=A0AAD8KCU6_TARER|nr:hypothetical protein QVD17_27276 [Tagetes erecta]
MDVTFQISVFHVKILQLLDNIPKITKVSATWLSGVNHPGVYLDLKPFSQLWPIAIEFAHHHHHHHHPLSPLSSILHSNSTLNIILLRYLSNLSTR